MKLFRKIDFFLKDGFPYQNFEENCKERLTSLSGLVFKKMLTMNALPENRTEFANLVSLKFHHCADACRRCPEGFGGKYSEFKSRGKQIFRIFPHLLLLPNFLAGIIFPSVSKAALYSDLANFLPNSSQHGHCCKFLGGEF